MSAVGRILLAMVYLGGAGVALGEEAVVRQEIPSRFAPPEMLQPALREVLSPEGRFVILQDKGAILVIDRPENIFAAAEAVQNLDVPEPDVQLDFGVRTGGRARVLGPVEAGAGIRYPTEYLPPRVVTGRGGAFAVVPAHPTRFTTRRVGDTMETTPTLNSDGSITLDINAESTEFRGFINYGSPILRAGRPGTIPIRSRVSNPRVFRPIIEEKTRVPVFETTRISTSVIVRPRVTGNRADVELVPELTLVDEEREIGAQKMELREYRTNVEIENGKLATVGGFSGASEEFNRSFFCDEGEPDGETVLVLKAQIRPASVAPEAGR